MKKYAEMTSAERKKIALIAFGIFLILAGIAGGIIALILPSGKTPYESEGSETTDSVGESGEHGEYTTTIWKDDGAQLLATNREALKGAENELLLLVCGDDEMYFSGSFISHVGSRTNYYNCDVTNDGVKDHIIILPTNSGTGLRGEEVHVFDGENLEEIPTDEPLEYLSLHSSFSADDRYYYVTYKEQEQRFRKSLFLSYGQKHEVEKPYIADYSYYGIRQNENGAALVCTYYSSVAEGNPEFLGAFEVTYSLKGERLACNDLDFSAFGICEVQNADWDMRAYNSKIVFANDESNVMFAEKNIRSVLTSDEDKLPYAYISDDEEFAVIVYYEEMEEEEEFPVPKMAYVSLRFESVLAGAELTLDDYLTLHGVDKASVSEYLSKDPPELKHTMEIFEENSEIVIRSKIESKDGNICLEGHLFRTQTTYKYEYYVDRTVVGDLEKRRDVLSKLYDFYSTEPLFIDAATAFIRKDTAILEELLGCQEGVLRQYADFEFGDYSFEAGEDSLSITVEIKKSSLPDVPVGTHTFSFTYGRFGTVNLKHLDNVDREQFSDKGQAMCESYILDWIGSTGMWDYSQADEINKLNDGSFQHKNLVAYLSRYGELKTVGDYKKAAKDIFGIEELSIPKDFLMEDGTVSIVWGHGGSVRTYRIKEIVTDKNAGIHTVYVQTYADFTGTVRSHIYEYKFEDHGTYLRIISSGIYEKGEYEPEERYFC